MTLSVAIYVAAGYTTAEAKSMTRTTWSTSITVVALATVSKSRVARAAFVAVWRRCSGVDALDATRCEFEAILANVQNSQRQTGRGWSGYPIEEVLIAALCSGFANGLTKVMKWVPRE